MIHTYTNKEFKMESFFTPNISNSKSLTVLEVTPTSVVIQMNNPECRGVFPLDSFQYWLKRDALIPIDEADDVELSM